MPIPEFTADGVLPPGDYALTMDELLTSPLVRRDTQASPAWDHAWRSQLAAADYGVGYEDWRAAVVLSKSSGSATIGFSNGQTGVLPAANAVQFDGTGTFNGAPASFRVCVQDNGEGSKAQPDQVHVACTAGCTFSGGGALGGGNVQVRQR